MLARELSDSLFLEMHHGPSRSRERWLSPLIHFFRWSEVEPLLDQALALEGQERAEFVAAVQEPELHETVAGVGQAS